MKDCLLVVPCFRESERVPRFLSELCRCVQASDRDVDVQLVDDGSGPAERENLGDLVKERQSVYPFLQDVIALEENQGKGAAIRSGWQHAQGAYRYFAFVDADGAVSGAEALRLLEIALRSDGALVLASRRVKEARADRLWLRRLVAASFSAMARFFYRVGVLDTQCGCKYIPADWYAAQANPFRENGFGFDLELIVRARETGLPLQEVGIAWQEAPGSKVNVESCYRLGKKVALRRIGRE